MIRVLGDRVLVALPPEPDEITTDSGLVLVKDPDILRTPTRGLVVGLGHKANTCDLDDARAECNEWFIEHARDWFTQDVLPHDVRDAVDRILMKLQPAGFEVQIGDCVIFPPHAGEQFEQGGIDYVVLHESELIGIVPKDNAA